MKEEEAKKEYTKLLKLCGMGYYKKLESGKDVTPIPDNLLSLLDDARDNWVKSKQLTTTKE